MGLGSIMTILSGVVLAVILFSSLSYKIGHASGAMEATTKLQKESFDEQLAAIDTAASAYARVPENPLEGARTNPFDY